MRSNSGLCIYLIATKPKAAIDPESKSDNNEATWQILLNIYAKRNTIKVNRTTYFDGAVFDCWFKSVVSDGWFAFSFFDNAS